MYSNKISNYSAESKQEGQYRISSNNSRGRLFLFSHQKGAIIRGKAIIRGRRLFQIFFTGGLEKVKYKKK